MHAGEAILQHGQLVDLAELLEDGPQVLLLQVAGDLTHEQLDGVLVLHGHGGGGPGLAPLLRVVLVLLMLLAGVGVGRRHGQLVVAVTVVCLQGEVVGVLQHAVLQNRGHAANAVDTAAAVAVAAAAAAVDEGADDEGRGR